ncbi:MAG: calcium/sodium antiporter [Candidatus Marinimicrobia bacterium]|nr:calcium/sodium antiporter [Candidatus Neomarinimicrobiota bacterium]
MEIAQDIVIIIFSILVIAKGSIWLVDSAAKIARRLGVSDLVIGLTIVAMGTSAPEFGVTILAAIRDFSNISVSNIVGSNIFNLGFILGGTAMVQGLRTSKKVVFRDGAFLLGGALLVTLFLWNLTLGRVEGIILFSLLVFYLGYLYFKREAPRLDEVGQRIDGMHWSAPLLLLAGIAMVLGGSVFMVEAAISLARIMGVSEWVIGATIVAAGTSAPEFATSISAVLRGHHGISVGNLIGSDIFNVFGVLGLAAMIRNLTVDPIAHSSLLMLVGMVVLVLIFMRSGWEVSRREGMVLVILGLARWIYSY